LLLPVDLNGGGVCLLLQVVLLAPLLWLLVSVVSCWDSTLPQPMLAPDGSSFRANGTKRKAA
jgi:hypothetical protein